MLRNIVVLILVTFMFLNCNSSDENILFDDNNSESGIYFPPLNTSNWETKSPSNLDWNTNEIENLRNYLINTNTKAFLILHNGKLVFEEYYNGFSATQNHTWNSAAKTLTATTIGIAQDEGLLNINNSSQNYLGKNWSSLTNEQELQINVKHHLTMTTGLDYEVANNDCTNKEDLIFRSNPDAFWYYHNAPYTISQKIVEGATNTIFDTYFNEKLKSKIGMQGSWLNFGCNRIFLSNARSMARFGLLILNKGKWETTQIVSETYLNAMTNTSQNLNKSYGYLWWLNGKESFKLPQSTATFQGKLIPNAPDDLIAGLGKNDQKLYIIPSKKLVIVRFGDASGSSLLGPSGYDNELWKKLNEVFN